ncbi:MAG: hypothetical protein NZ893_02975 [Candidatus Aenigmarchaeota archaeon]|nr:hypothetical protein [Candidatus Aenigmarchaeota archaeon]
MPIIGIREVSIILMLLPIVFAQEKTEDILFTYEIYTFPAKVTVLDKYKKIEIGFSGNTDILDFGQIYVGMQSKKYINISANDNFRVILKSSGNITSILEFEKNNFLLKKSETIMLPIKVKPTQPGNYSGEVKLIFKKIKLPILKWLLLWF